MENGAGETYVSVEADPCSLESEPMLTCLGLILGNDMSLLATLESDGRVGTSRNNGRLPWAGKWIGGERKRITAWDKHDVRSSMIFATGLHPEWR